MLGSLIRTNPTSVARRGSNGRSGVEVGSVFCFGVLRMHLERPEKTRRLCCGYVDATTTKSVHAVGLQVKIFACQVMSREAAYQLVKGVCLKNTGGHKSFAAVAAIELQNYNQSG
ncbi:hypothetical protein O9992_11580 [Vibrio lentus]|nr:hypothetical protein [Vibrio lentus]